MCANTGRDRSAEQADRHAQSAADIRNRLTLLLSSQACFAEVNDSLYMQFNAAARR